MSSKKTRRQPNELKSLQDERLTCRHIQTLMKLQQCNDENEQLKMKVKALQDETSSCQELHKVARGSQKKIEQLKEDFCKEMDEKVKMMNCVNQQKLNQLLEEKQKLQKSSERKKNEMEMLIQSLEMEIKDKNEKLETLTEKQNSFQELQDKFQSCLLKLEAAEEKNNKLTKELSEVKSSNAQLQNEKVNDSKNIFMLESKITKMAEKLESEIETKRKLMEQNDFVKEIHKLRETIDDLETKQKAKEEILSERREYIQECELKLSSLEKSKSLLELERDALSQSSTDLTREVEYLKRMDSRSGSAGNTFNEYVSMKRELALLKEENARLKNASSKLELKTLKADGKKTGRVLSSTRISKSNIK